MKFALSLLIAAMPIAACAAGDCFSIYDAANALVYRSSRAPIDLSQSISDGMAAKYPGHYLVWARREGSCIETGDGDQADGAQRGTAELALRRSALFTFAADVDRSGASSDESFPYPSSSRSGNTRPAGTDINVRSYTRSNGTVVSGHTKASAGSGSRR